MGATWLIWGHIHIWLYGGGAAGVPIYGYMWGGGSTPGNHDRSVSLSSEKRISKPFQL